MTVELSRAGYSVRGLANWVLDYADCSGANLTNMSLNKLVYFLVEALVIKQRRLITNAKIEAWEHGPVFREVYQSFKRFGDQPITGRASFFSTNTNSIEISTVNLIEQDENEMRSVLAPLISKKAAELRGMSHVKGGAWHRVWWYDGHANPGMEITPESIVELNEGR